MKLYQFPTYTVLLEDRDPEPSGHLGVFDVDKDTAQAITEGVMPILGDKEVSIDKEELVRIRKERDQQERANFESEERRKYDAAKAILASIQWEKDGRPEDIKALESLILMR